MRFSSEHGHAILNRNKTVHYLPTDTLDIAACPVQPGQLVPLHFPEVALDSYGQTILDRDGQPKTTLVHDHKIRILTVRAEDADGIPGTAVFEIRFKLEVVDKIIYMQTGGGTTTALARAICGEDVGYVNPNILDPAWERAARRRHLEAVDNRPAEPASGPTPGAFDQRIADTTATANTRNVDINSELRLVRHLYAQGRHPAAERKLREIETRFLPAAA